MTSLTTSAPPPTLRPDPEPPDRLRVEAWADPVVDGLGHDPRSPYVERFWLGILGPSATWLLRRLADRLDEEPGGFELDLDLLAGELGLGMRGGAHAPVRRALARCVTFGMARETGHASLAVRRRLPPLPRRHLLRLPVELQERHRHWLAAQRATPAVDELRRRARRLALSVAELGEDRAGVEQQLTRWRVHPALAHEAATWALSQVRPAGAGPERPPAPADRPAPAGDGPPDT